MQRGAKKKLILNASSFHGLIIIYVYLITQLLSATNK